MHSTRSEWKLVGRRRRRRRRSSRAWQPPWVCLISDSIAHTQLSYWTTGEGYAHSLYRVLWIVMCIWTKSMFHRIELKTTLHLCRDSLVRSVKYCIIYAYNETLEHFQFHSIHSGYFYGAHLSKFPGGQFWRGRVCICLHSVKFLDKTWFLRVSIYLYLCVCTLEKISKNKIY